MVIIRLGRPKNDHFFMIIIDCTADLHGFYPKLKGGDLLIVAGDLTKNDDPMELYWFGEWLRHQPYRMKICIAGNHDNNLMSSKSFDASLTHFVYLCDSGIEFEGLKIWGSPWTTRFEGMNPHCTAFTVDTDEELAEKWALIPDDTDILITHSPPKNIFDRTIDRKNVGSSSLLELNVPRKYRLKLHVFGHIHENYGIHDIRKTQKKLGDPITPVFVNASHVNENYKPVNKPIRVIL